MSSTQKDTAVDPHPVITHRSFGELAHHRVRLVRFSSGHHLLTFDGERSQWQLALDPADVVALQVVLAAIEP